MIHKPSQKGRFVDSLSSIQACDYAYAQIGYVMQDDVFDDASQTVLIALAIYSQKTSFSPYEKALISRYAVARK